MFGDLLGYYNIAALSVDHYDMIDQVRSVTCITLKRQLITSHLIASTSPS